MWVQETGGDGGIDGGRDGRMVAGGEFGGLRAGAWTTPLDGRLEPPHTRRKGDRATAQDGVARVSGADG